MNNITIDIRKKMLTATGWLTLDVRWQGPAGALTTVFGPSGAGKTTLLRSIAGLSRPDEGVITVGGEVWFDSHSGIDLLPQKRCVGYLFQEYSLFPNMTVLDNVLYALPGKAQRSDADDLIDLVGLKFMLNRYPVQLSGGQQQRVALARALARKPKVLLLDEPFSAVDDSLRLGLQNDVLAIQRQSGVTVLMVTHDLGEVFKMSDAVMVLKDGRVESCGRPQDTMIRPEAGTTFKVMAEVLDIMSDSFVSIFTLRIGNNIVRLVETDGLRETVSVGDRVLVASSAFNPDISRLSA